MATKTFKGRIQNKHDTEANWKVAANFKPLAGELIIYDKDDAHSTLRFKVGDGSTLVRDLPFINGSMEFDTDGFSYEDYGGNVGFFSPMSIILSGPEYKASYGITSIGYKNISTDVEYNLNFPTKSGTFAVTDDIDITAAGNNTFTGDNEFNKKVTFSKEIQVGDLTGVAPTLGIMYKSVADGGVNSSYISFANKMGGDNNIYYTYLPHKSGAIALTSDIPVANSGTGTTELTSLKIGDTIYTIPSGGGSGDVTAAGDNTFTGNNTFTGDFSRKTRDSSGVIYYKESISDQGFTVGVGATEAATGTQAIYGYGSIKVTAGAAGTGTLSLPVKTGTLALTSDISAVKTGFFPVGYIYITTSSASPAGIFGGTWEQIKDKFLLAAGDTYTAGSTGGSADAVVVEHRHLQSVSPSSGTDSGVSTWEATTLYNGGNKITAYTSYEGVNGAGKNLPPYLVVHVWKRIA